MSLIPGTDGEFDLKQGRNLELAFTAEREDSDPCYPIPEDLTGYGFRGKIRAAMESDEVILDFADYATIDLTTATASVFVAAGITALIEGRYPVDWIAGAEFYLIGSDPEEVIDAGTYTVHFKPDPAR